MPATRRPSARSLDQVQGASRQCPYCDRNFNRTEHLERHVRSHTREKPFQCQDCGNRYSRRDTLLRHERQHSSDTFTPSTGCAPDRANSTVSSKGNANAAGITDQASAASEALLADTPSSFSSKQLHSTSRSIGLQGISSVHDHAESTAQQGDVLPMDDTLSSAPVQPLGPPFDNCITDPMAPFDVSLDFGWGQEFPSWFVDPTMTVQSIFSPFDLDDMQTIHNAPTTSGEYFSPTSEPPPDIGRLWFTNFRASEESHPASGTVTPAEVDENYRQTMRRSLHIRPLDTSLPSPDYINLCIRLYFTRFHPKFPVIHVPTFRPSKKNSMLLLSICSIGSVITGTADGLARGTHIWDILNKAVLAKWERLVSQTDDRFAIMQAALLGQTFALLSGNPKHLAAAEAYHGALISVARSSRMFQLSHRRPPELSSRPNDLDAEWWQWAREEEFIRTALGLYLHDAELAHIFHHEPLLRPSRRVSCAASDELFAARHPKEWLSRLQQHDDTRNTNHVRDAMSNAGSTTNIEHLEGNSKFTRYVQLECILATVLEERLSERLDDSTKQALASNLMEFHKQYLQLLALQETGTLEMEILWHLSFISLCTDFDLLERVVGRDGAEATEEDLKRVREWAASPDAYRATIHIRVIRQKLDSLSIGLVPAVHIPRAIFFVAVCCYCAFSFSTAGEPFPSSTFDFPELPSIGIDHNALSAGRLAALETKETLCHLADVLQRLGHWGIARKFGAIVEALLRQFFV